jgi:hypothetical protein
MRVRVPSTVQPGAPREAKPSAGGEQVVVQLAEHPR